MDAGPLRAGELRVVGFRGREAVSRPYRWDVTVDAADVDHDAVESLLLGARASLSLPLREAEPRIVHGVIAAVTHVDVAPDGLHLRLRLRLVPRLWLLSRNRVSRVFQDMTAPEVVAEVLTEAGIPFEARLVQRCPRRVYCVQYEESDLAFVSRLLAEEGIFYFFEHPTVAFADAPEGGELLVLADRAAACPPIRALGVAPQGLVVGSAPPPGSSPALYLHHGEGMVADEHHVSKLSRERRVRPQAVLIRDYDFRRPSVDLTAAQTAAPLAAALTSVGAREDFPELLHRTLAAVTRGTPRPDLPPVAVDATRAVIYEHHGEDEDPEVNRPEAQIRLEQHRRSVVTAHGEAWCRRLSAGHRFCLENHPDASLNAEYTLTEVRHVGRTVTDDADSARAACECSFVCVPAWAAPRPSRPRRVHRQVLETARVTGTAGEEIHTDAHGRVKVRFHWDLRGGGDDRSSCWLRVAQGWAGTHWGTQFIPRVGMEVLVGFLGGDQDRPVVLGCLYNGENPPAFATPDNRTRSGLRTQSSPGGGGYNELSFEDAKGAEQVFLRAERDLDEVVRRDHTARVGRDEHVAIDRHQTTRVEGNRREEVLGERTLYVQRERRETNDGPLNVTTRGPEHRWNLDSVEHRVEGRARYLHTTAVDEDFDDELTVRARGCVTTLVGAVDEERHWGLHVEGTSEHYASKGHEIRSNESIVLRCGTSTMVISPSTIDLVADTVTLRSGNTVVTVDEKAIAARAEDTITLEGQKKARLLAPDVLMTKAEALPEAEQPSPPTRILLTDTGGRPLAGRRYRVKQGDGTVRTGFLDRDGAALIPGMQGGMVEFPEFDEVQR